MNSSNANSCMNTSSSDHPKKRKKSKGASPADLLERIQNRLRRENFFDLSCDDHDVSPSSSASTSLQYEPDNVHQKSEAYANVQNQQMDVVLPKQLPPTSHFVSQAKSDVAYIAPHLVSGSYQQFHLPNDPLCHQESVNQSASGTRDLSSRLGPPTKKNVLNQISVAAQELPFIPGLLEDDSATIFQNESLFSKPSISDFLDESFSSANMNITEEMSAGTGSMPLSVDSFNTPLYAKVGRKNSLVCSTDAVETSASSSSPLTTLRNTSLFVSSHLNDEKLEIRPLPKVNDFKSSAPSASSDYVYPEKKTSLLTSVVTKSGRSGSMLLLAGLTQKKSGHESNVTHGGSSHVDYAGEEFRSLPISKSGSTVSTAVPASVPQVNSCGASVTNKSGRSRLMDHWIKGSSVPAVDNCSGNSGSSTSPASLSQKSTSVELTSVITKSGRTGSLLMLANTSQRKEYNNSDLSKIEKSKSIVSPSINVIKNIDLKIGENKSDISDANKSNLTTADLPVKFWSKFDKKKPNLGSTVSTKQFTPLGISKDISADKYSKSKDLVVSEAASPGIERSTTDRLVKGKEKLSDNLLQTGKTIVNVDHNYKNKDLLANNSSILCGMSNSSAQAINLSEFPSKIFACNLCKLTHFVNESDYNQHLESQHHSHMFQLLTSRNDTLEQFKRAGATLASRVLEYDLLKGNTCSLTLPVSGNANFSRCSYCQCTVINTAVDLHNQLLQHKELVEFMRPLCCGIKFVNRRSYESHKSSKKHLEKRYELEIEFIAKTVNNVDEEEKVISCKTFKDKHSNYIEKVINSFKVKPYVPYDKIDYCLVCEVSVPNFRKSFHPNTTDHHENMYIYLTYYETHLKERVQEYLSAEKKMSKATSTESQHVASTEDANMDQFMDSYSIDAVEMPASSEKRLFGKSFSTNFEAGDDDDDDDDEFEYNFDVMPTTDNEAIDADVERNVSKTSANDCIAEPKQSSSMTVEKTDKKLESACTSDEGIIPEAVKEETGGDVQSGTSLAGNVSVTAACGKTVSLDEKIPISQTMNIPHSADSKEEKCEVIEVDSSDEDDEFEYLFETNHDEVDNTAKVNILDKSVNSAIDGVPEKTEKYVTVECREEEVINLKQDTFSKSDFYISKVSTEQKELKIKTPSLDINKILPKEIECVQEDLDTDFEYQFDTRVDLQIKSMTEKEKNSDPSLEANIEMPKSLINETSKEKNQFQSQSEMNEESDDDFDYQFDGDEIQQETFDSKSVEDSDQRVDSKYFAIKLGTTKEPLEEIKDKCKEDGNSDHKRDLSYVKNEKSVIDTKTRRTSETMKSETVNRIDLVSDVESFSKTAVKQSKVKDSMEHSENDDNSSDFDYKYESQSVKQLQPMDVAKADQSSKELQTKLGSDEDDDEFDYQYESTTVENTEKNIEYSSVSEKEIPLSNKGSPEEIDEDTEDNIYFDYQYETTLEQESANDPANAPPSVNNISKVIVEDDEDSDDFDFQYETVPDEQTPPENPSETSVSVTKPAKQIVEENTENDENYDEDEYEYDFELPEEDFDGFEANSTETAGKSSSQAKTVGNFEIKNKTEQTEQVQEHEEQIGDSDEEDLDYDYDMEDYQSEALGETPSKLREVSEAASGLENSSEASSGNIDEACNKTTKQIMKFKIPSVVPYSSHLVPAAPSEHSTELLEQDSSAEAVARNDAHTEASSSSLPNVIQVDASKFASDACKSQDKIKLLQYNATNLPLDQKMPPDKNIFKAKNAATDTNTSKRIAFSESHASSKRACIRSVMQEDETLLSVDCSSLQFTKEIEAESDGAYSLHAGSKGVIFNVNNSSSPTKVEDESGSNCLTLKDKNAEVKIDSSNSCTAIIDVEVIEENRTQSGCDESSVTNIFNETIDKPVAKHEKKSNDFISTACSVKLAGELPDSQTLIDIDKREELEKTHSLVNKSTEHVTETSDIFIKKIERTSPRKKINQSTVDPCTAQSFSEEKRECTESLKDLQDNDKKNPVDLFTTSCRIKLEKKLSGTKTSVKFDKGQTLSHKSTENVTDTRCKVIKKAERTSLRRQIKHSTENSSVAKVFPEQKGKYIETLKDLQDQVPGESSNDKQDEVHFDSLKELQEKEFLKKTVEADQKDDDLPDEKQSASNTGDQKRNRSSVVKKEIKTSYIKKETSELGHTKRNVRSKMSSKEKASNVKDTLRSRRVTADKRATDSSVIVESTLQTKNESVTLSESKVGKKREANTSIEDGNTESPFISNSRTAKRSRPSGKTASSLRYTPSKASTPLAKTPVSRSKSLAKTGATIDTQATTRKSPTKSAAKTKSPALPQKTLRVKRLSVAPTRYE